MDQDSEKQPKVKALTPIYTGAEEYQPDAEKQELHRLYPYMPSKDLREAVNLAIYLKRPLLIKGEPGSGKTRLAFAVAHEFSEKYRKYREALKEEYDRELEEKAAALEAQRQEKAAASEGEPGTEPAEDEGEPEKKPTEGETKDEKAEPNPFAVKDDKGYPGWPFYFWPVKSTSRAQDGLYTYDAVGRLHNATLPEGVRKEDKVEDYIKYGPLGKAFQYGSLGKHYKTEKLRPIVLIDEIDKADIDFPNDLLIELEDPKFKVRELEDREISSAIDPIIFVTSNDEKALPDAFLRRCIFFYINFPEKEQLREIIRKRIPDHNEDLVIKAVDVFMELRKELEAKKGKARKLPSTSELIDWVKVLHRNAETDEDDLPISEEAFRELGDEEAIREYFENLEHAEKLMVDQVINLLDGRLPFLSVLIKNYNDYEEYIKEQKEKEKEKEKNKTTTGPAGGEPAVVQPVAEQPAADKSQES